ncbi:MAG: bacterioferritin [Pseudomonadota bacterium]|nr:bacterioferritin [Pseudomonadota bacterium]
MNGNSAVIDYLNMLLAGELSARDQYFIHSRMYEDWGLPRLYERINHEMQEEASHADAILRRLLFLQAKPKMTPDPVRIGESVVDALKIDLELEYAVRERLAKGIALCEQHQDFVTRDMLLAQLKDTEEDHTLWLEQQLGLIEKIGLPNYLQSQMAS